jgi:hypothetical protein
VKRNLAIGALLLLPILAAEEGISIRMEAGAFRVTGWTPPHDEPAAGWPSIFAVYVSFGDGDVPPMLGSYTVEAGALVFHPRYPLGAHVSTRAIFHSPAGDIQTIFDPPPFRLSSSTRVSHVYPSTDLLPDNQLKFYVYFSAPMRRGEAWQHIHLLQQNGAPVDLPFLELDQELWDRDYQRLTVLFDPGRIKRGLVPLQEVGPSIEEGKQYTLVIDREWLDAHGAPLEAVFRKPFRVGPADRTPPDPAQWRLTAPKPGTTGALLVKFPKPMDYALLQRLLDVPGVAGTVTVGREETEWRFTPEKPWKSGEYRLSIDTALEDLAGNRIGRAFDVDTFERVSERLSRKTVSLPFRVGENQR